ncbi:hypothetical protein [Streptosporangium sp. NPDC002721]|uniref:hypothetical protein n=1 Tax=Streptosporangium sp. NPDC002721 TaxID=3366188 RepID=UPI00368A1C95
MGKFEGMDPKLVRDLLSEVQRAAERMRNVEGKVSQLMSGAGLSSQSTHRPVQIADACDVMVRDVSARVTLLEKKVSQNTTAPTAEPKAGDPKPEAGSPGEGAKPQTDSQNGAKPEAGSQNGAKPESPKAEDLKPAVGGDDKPRVGDQSDESTRRDDPKDPKPDTKPETPKADTPKAEEGKPEAGSKGDETSPRDDRDDRKETPKPEASGGDERKPETGSKADETSPREGETSKETGKDSGKEAGKETGKPTDSAPREVPRADPAPEPPRAEEPRPEPPRPDPAPEPPRAEEPRPEPPRPDPAPEPPRAEEPRPEPPAPDPVPEAPRAEDTRPEAPAPDRAPQVPNAEGAPVPGTPNAEGAPAPEAPRQDSAPAPDAPRTDAPRADDARPEAPRVEDLKPAVPGPGENPQGGGQPVDTAPREAPDVPRTPETPAPDSGLVPERPQGEPTPGAEDRRPEIVNADDTTRGQDQAGNVPVNDSDAKGDTGSKGDDTTPRGDSTGNAPDAKGDTGSKGDETTPRGDSTGNAPDAKGDAGSKGDERSPRDGGGTSGDTVHDTPRKDHPDDIDQSGDSRAKVVEVDGVKVLQIPLDAPTAAEVDELLKNIEDIPPLEMPTIDGASATVGQPGWVEPHAPLDSARPAYPLLDTAGPATDQTVQPPGTGGDTTSPQSTGTTSGEPAAPQPAPATQGDAAPRPAGTASGEPAIQTAGTTSGEAATRPAGEPVPSIGDAVSGEARGAEGASGQAAGAAPGGVAAQAGEGGGGGEGGEGAVARWANDGSDVVTAEARPLDLDALRTLADNVREIEPLEMPGVSVPDGETWGEGAWVPMDIGPDGPAGDVDPGDPLRPIPPPGGGR